MPLDSSMLDLQFILTVWEEEFDTNFIYLKKNCFVILFIFFPIGSLSTSLRED